jgi:glycosyltransferase involved in cell wall biosynthesis
MVTNGPHIAICICAYKRPHLLSRLLYELGRQRTESLFEYSITIVDNDVSQSSNEVVAEFRKTSPLLITYYVEPEQNIALARNKALANAKGDFIAFIDDDELPEKDWLLALWKACEEYGVDGVLGPVKPEFAVAPPEWALKAGIFDRPNSQDYHSGLVLHWSQTGTGNALIQRRVLDEVEGPFKQEFGSGGEDIDFFRRAMKLGKVFVWCAEAVTYEIIPVERTRISFQLRRALLRGKGSLASPSGRPFGILKSIVACAAYTMLLPISLLIGRHVFLKYLVKTCDHLGKLLSLVRIDLVKEKYVLE